MSLVFQMKEWSAVEKVAEVVCCGFGKELYSEEEEGHWEECWRWLAAADEGQHAPVEDLLLSVGPFLRKTRT